MRQNKVLLILFFGSVLAACAPDSSSSTQSDATATGNILATAHANDMATQTAKAEEQSPADVFATALAADQATKAAGPTKAATSTPKPIGTLDPNLDYWWNDTIFYEVFIRSFYDSDGDGVGDINGLIEKLDYLNDGDPITDTDLGVTGLWLMPMMESPSYHGYDVVDYYSVDKEYGTTEDFMRLIHEAHKRGIRVTIDLVINHSSSQNPWFVASNSGDPAYRDWYIWSKNNPGYPGPWGQPQVWYAGMDGYYYAVFSPGMPDLNLNNPAVTEEIYRITRFWLEVMGVDGFRMDAVRHLIENGPVQADTTDTHSWLYEFHKFYKGIDPGAFTVGETLTDTSNAAKYAGYENDIAFEFSMSKAFMEAASGSKPSKIVSTLENVLSNYPTNQFGVFLTNHDQNRVMSVLGEIKKAKIAAAFLLTSPGVPFLYYGEEIGMAGTKPDEDIRRPMQWTGEDNVGFTTGVPWRLPDANYRTVNVAAQNNDPDSLLSYYRELIHLRNQSTALRSGDTLLVETGNPRLYAVLRYTDREAVMVLINLLTDAITTSQYSLNLLNGPFRGNINAQSIFGPIDNPTSTLANSGGGFNSYNPFPEIPGQTVMIIQLSP